MYNKIIFLGNLTRDVELRYLPNGNAVATIGLASTKKFKTQDGQKEEVCFVDCKLFGRTAEIANQYLRKGSKVLIEGRLTYETWNDSTGNKKSRHTIVAESMQMLGSDQQQSQAQAHQHKEATKVDMSRVLQQSSVPEINIGNEIPF